MSLQGDVARILTELRAQGWDVTLQGTAYRCTPPSPGKQIVFFSKDPAGARSIPNIIRDLKHQGFAWPPPTSRLDKAATAEAVYSAAPFAPAPHPDGGTRPPPPPPPAKSNGIAHGQDAEDALFAALKEARQYRELARQELEQVNAEIRSIQERLIAAKGAFEEAEYELAKARDAFDQCFGAQEAPSP